MDATVPLDTTKMPMESANNLSSSPLAALMDNTSIQLKDVLLVQAHVEPAPQQLDVLPVPLLDINLTTKEFVLLNVVMESSSAQKPVTPEMSTPQDASAAKFSPATPAVDNHQCVDQLLHQFNPQLSNLQLFNLQWFNLQLQLNHTFINQEMPTSTQTMCS